MNMGSEYVNEDLFGLEDEDIGEEINSRTNVTNISSGDMVVQNRRSGKMNQTTINDAYKKEARERACMLITRWMYEAAILFNVVTYPSFQPMIEAIGQYGVGMKGPTFHEVSGPLVRVLHLVDGEKQAPMGYIYEAMNRAKDTIVRSFNGNEEKYKEIFNIIDKRWEIQLHRPLHAARLTRDSTKQEKVVAEVSLFTNAQGLFGNELAVRTRKTRAPGRMEDEDSHGGTQDDFVFYDDNLTWGDVARAAGAEEARFDTRARARASSSIIPPTRGIASSSRTLPSHSLVDEDEDGDIVDSAYEEDGEDYKCGDGNDDDDDDFVDLEEE
ncbi:hypothetical protein CK203_032183 [Vitis vinifera]|uniref:Uncharacterized protein n=1 Tax=Vitis vinifera TaxID=29760 RepID=A0A438IPF5_VITVI|nr:hypothetical protein CK203_032183 [Vitis vinifera]